MMNFSGLNASRVDGYLRRLGVNNVQHTVAGLTELQSSHLMAVPFHNLQLLANDGRRHALPPLEQVVDQAIAGEGGNCDRTTPPFAALLSAVGFDAQLAAARVRHDGDHFVSLVQLDGQCFLCDVGNGQPYLQPWRLDGDVQRQTHCGWQFRFDPAAAGGPTLYRRLTDGSWKTVYEVDPKPRLYRDFAPMVERHYSQPGFGPFLSGLRAVSIQAKQVLILRDKAYERHNRLGMFQRPVFDRAGFEALLTERFKLMPSLVGSALDAVEKRPGSLLSRKTPGWWSLGVGEISGCKRKENKIIPLPEKPLSAVKVPDILVSLASTGRYCSVQRLLDSLEREVAESGYPGKVGVLLIDNSELTSDTTTDNTVGKPRATLSVGPHVKLHRQHISDFQHELSRSAQLGLLPPIPAQLPMAIGHAREAQLAALAQHLKAPYAELPHPDQRPTLVWMVDDDIRFEQLDSLGHSGRRTNLLFRAARYWASMPACSVVLGGFEGDPPTPALDGLQGQLSDVVSNLKRLLSVGPAATWQPQNQPSYQQDAHYDFAASQAGSNSGAWPFAKHRAGESTSAVALALLQSLPRLLDGHLLTRLPRWDGSESMPCRSLRRGGNTLFLDFDTIFRWPTPALQCADGVVTRRADTLWATLAAMDSQADIFECTLPVLHDRQGQARDQAGECSAAAAAASTTAQVRGVALARALATNTAVAAELTKRETMVCDQRQSVNEQLQQLPAQMSGLREWHDPVINEAMNKALAALQCLQQRVSDSKPIAGDSQELDDFLQQLPARVKRWQANW